MLHAVSSNLFGILRHDTSLIIIIHTWTYEIISLKHHGNTLHQRFESIDVEIQEDLQVFNIIRCLISLGRLAQYALSDFLNAWPLGSKSPLLGQRRRLVFCCINQANVPMTFVRQLALNGTGTFEETAPWQGPAELSSTQRRPQHPKLSIPWLSFLSFLQ